MSRDITLAYQQQRKWGRVYLKLTKPKVVALMLVTAVVGMSLAPVVAFPWLMAILGLSGIGLMAASAAAFNHLIDRRIDAKMTRTYNRPLPSGETNPTAVFIFASLLGGFGFAILYLGVNTLTAWLTLLSLLGYAVIYTLYLKRATPQNIVIAGIAGAMPPLLGWTSVSGELHANAWLLVMIIFIWTPPHFWALAIHRVEDYRKADIPMLPVTHGIEYTKTSVLLYSILLALVCVLPVLVGMAGSIYLFSVLVLNAGFIYHAWRLKYAPQPNSAIETFKFSIYHLFLLFIALLVDHYLG